MADRPALSVVLPAYDEEARIADGVGRALAFLAAQDYGTELIVVSDGSRDATARIARSVGGDRVHVIETPGNRGKGHAVRTGALAANGEHVLFSDVDLSTPLDEVGRFLARHAQGADVVIGSRALPASDVRVRQAWWREAMGRTFNRVARRVAGVTSGDTQCGFKSFRRAAARAIFERARIDRYAFDVELLWIARALGLRVAELPVVWTNHPQSKVDPVRDAARMLADLGAIRWHAARGRYGPTR
jgi:glycosyltransferase involved in cell wall biosynthesis